ncbi:MAG TPA: DUF763 domain-containing protein [Candidatus Omnitrophota bacterium]|nr:DUF763 domain-containing protein [Candidatus Omnitrophota bacterium]HPS20326.1 DUF763 domain-containing protein [Candidatus Omnitrophota bacterium]
MRKGIAHLPLHGGKAPAWLFSRMTLLAREISWILCYEFGPHEFLRKLADPFWFQAFGCVLGFDWHSSGVTTTVCGAVKEGLKDISKEIGVFACGGKGGTSRKTPLELEALAQKRLIDANAEELKYASRMSAKVDNTAVQDGYQLYHHSFFVDKSGHWAVVQQGMNETTRWARRYHWLGEDLSDFVCEPHKAVCCDKKENNVLNMVATESNDARNMCADLSCVRPEKIVLEYTKIADLKMARHHEVLLKDIRPENLGKILLKTYEKQPKNFASLLDTQGVGPGTIRALAMVSEIIYGKAPSFKDPVRFSFAHGGKDGFPYPVNRERYDKSIQILRDAISKTKIGQPEKVKAIQRLSNLM